MMARKCFLLWVLASFAAAGVCSAATAAYRIVDDNYGIGALNRTSFPAGFIFGAASSSYQYEGAAREDGKGPSIWDVYSHKYPGFITDGRNGDVSIDSYHKYKIDVTMIKQMGLDAYRFSISWPRLLPNGKLSGGVNKKGVMFYNNLINELLANGIQPYATLFHWDTPEALEQAYGGFLSPYIVDDFRDFSDLCYREFGDRVKHWITLNEPYTYTNGGYAARILAPFRCSKWQGLNCTGGDSATEPYLVGHHLLLSHSAAVDLYRRKYQASQKGQIGITLVANWYAPYSSSKQDKQAASRALEFMYDWFLSPVTYGDYPKSMKALVGSRLPKFTPQQAEMLKGSFDFLGLNYYTAYYAVSAPSLRNAKPSLSYDFLANLTAKNQKGHLIGPLASPSWLYVYPNGIRELLLYTKRKYNNPTIYITENGVAEENNSTLPLKQALKDPNRIQYYHSHLAFLNLAIKEGVTVKGYFAWSLMDNYEWNNGYTERFGLIYVDYQHGLKRYPKQSALWFKKFLQK